jgi:Ca2+/Na+ antiporter
VALFIFCQPAIFFCGRGVMGELDFWGGTFCLVIFATVEIILFGWVLGMERAWQEIHHGAEMEVPAAYRFIIKYVTPLFLIVILVSWFVQEWIPIMLMAGVSAADRPFVLGTRAFLVAIFMTLALLVKVAWRNKRKGKT